MKRITKHRTGYLSKRGRVYYLEYMLDGKRVKRALRDDKGNPVTDRKKAETRRTEIMAPLTVADQQAALESVRKRLGDTDSRSVPTDRLPGPGASTLTIDKAWAAYVGSTKRPDSGPRTLAAYESQFRLFAAWMAEKYSKRKEMRSVTSEMADQYAAYLLRDDVYPKALRTKKRKKWPQKDEKPTPKRPVTANTFNKHIRVLELVFRVLKKKASLTENPWSEIGKKVERKHGRRELTVDEINAIVRKAEGELKTLLLLGIYTGMRLGDCCTLRWAEVDLARHIILRVPNKTARRKGEPVHIPVHPTLKTVLSETPAAKNKGLVLPGFAAKYRRNSSNVTDEMREHFTLCGIRVHREGTGRGTGNRAIVEVGFHSLRHSFVSLCRQANTPLAVVEAIVGHSNPAMTRHYTHVGEIAAGQAVAALPVMGDDDAKTKAPAKERLSVRDQKLVSILTQSSLDTWERDRDAALAVLLG